MNQDEFFTIFAFPAKRPYEEQDFYRLMLCQETQEFLRDAIRRYEPKLIVEVGSWYGYSAYFMAQQTPTAKIVAIDTWRGSPEFHESQEYIDKIPESYARFVSNNWLNRDRMYAMPMDGVSGLRILHIAELKPDLIFIDGNHEYEGAFGDIHLAMRRFPEAPIVLDDYLAPGVKQAADECRSKFNRKCTADRNTALIHPGSDS